jgi:hypothetical protein
VKELLKIPAANRDAQGSAGVSTSYSNNEATNAIEALEKYKKELTPFEKADILKVSEVYTIGTQRIWSQA